MIIFPAIDIKAGKVVRLVQGRFDKVTEYGNDPLVVARHWVELGVKGLHLIDLDGAKTGVMANFDAIAAIVKNVAVPVQVGGGIRREADIENLLAIGVKRVILGTKAIEDRDFLKKILSCCAERVAVSLDCQEGKVALAGWTNVTSLSVETVARELEALGLQCLIYTDIRRDGMLTGPDLVGLKNLLTVVKIPIIASGGIMNLDDIKNLLALGPRPLLGAITGKAIYEGTLSLKEALALCSPNA